MDYAVKKDFLEDINKMTEVEWLEKNQFGLYSSSTIVGMNTRREHGLFVVPDENNNMVVLLSKLEESVFVGNQLYELSTNNYDGGVFPTGYKYLENFELNNFPKWTFSIEGRRLEKTIVLLNDQKMMIVRYELKNQGSPISLIIKPFIADRFANEMTNQTQGLNTDSYLGNHFVRWAIKSNMPELYIYYNSGEFIPAILWYKNFVYKKDKGRFSQELEHLFNPGFFKVMLNPYNSVELYISTEELNLDLLDFEDLYRNETDFRKRTHNLFFVNYPALNKIEKSLCRKFNKGSHLISSSTIENVYFTRDLVFSLPGSFLINEQFEEFKKVVHYLADHLTEGLLPVYLPDIRKQNNYTTADISLWFVQILYEYYSFTKDISFFENGLYNDLRSIFESFKKGTICNIYLDKDGLVFAGSKSISASWIPLQRNDNNVLRYGKLLEVNALWYNYLKVMEKISLDIGKKRYASKFAKQAELCKTSFNERFIENGDLLDFFNTETINKDFRINSLIAVCLPYRIIDAKLTKIILEKISVKLLTPYGIKSKENDVASISNLHRKNPLYFNGAIWPWAVMFYIDARLNQSEDKLKTAVYLENYFKPLFELLDRGMINYLPEVISNGSKITTGGMEDFTPSLACVLWGYFKLLKVQEKI